MDSLMDEIDSLVEPDLSTSATDWCENCQALRKDLKKLQDEQEQSFVKLKQKIISTDLLIKKYKSKCEDYDVQYKKNEEATRRADKYQRQSEILETQLKATLMETEPLRLAKTALESEVKQKNTEIEDLKNKLIVTEGAQRQYEHLNKSSTVDIEKLEAEKRALNVRIKVLESGKVTKEAAKELKVENHSLKKENTNLKKREKKLEKKLKSALSKIDHLTEKLKENRMVPVERRRRTTSGSLLSPVRSPYRSPRAQKSSTSTSGTSPKTSPRKIGQKSSPKLPNSGERIEESDLEESNDEISEDDVMSLFSVKWTFSPVMQCLSPLPPSPLNQFNQTESRKSWMDANLSDDDNLSDMADELEQQLLKGDSLEDDAQDDGQVCKIESGNALLKTKPELNCKDSAGATYGEVDEHDTNCKSDSGNELQSNKNILHITQNIKNDESGFKADKEISREKSCQGIEIACAESKFKDQKANLPDNTVKEKAIAVLEEEDVKQTVREKLAASIEIVSPRATKKRIAHRSASCDNKTDLRSPAILPSQSLKLSVGTVDKSEEDTFQNGELAEPLHRNDTTEFDPVINKNEEGDRETHTEEDTPDSDKLNIDTPYITNTCFTDTNKSFDKCEYQVPEVNKGTGTRTMNTQMLPLIPEEEEDVNKQTFKCETPSCQNSSNSHVKELVKEVQGEIEIDIREESEIVDFPRKTPPPVRGHLIRQGCVQKQGDNIVDGVNLEGRGLMKTKSKMIFQSFQKASYGTLEDEINNLQDANDYNILTREHPQTTDKTGREKKLKSIKKNLKSKCKFVDLDSAGGSESKQEQFDIVSAFTKQSPKVKVHRSDLNETKEEKLVRGSSESKPGNCRADVNVTSDETEDKNSHELSLGHSNNSTKPNTIPENQSSIETICDNIHKDFCDDKDQALCGKSLLDSTKSHNDTLKPSDLADEEDSRNCDLKPDKTDHAGESVKKDIHETSLLNKTKVELKTAVPLNDSDGELHGVETELTETGDTTKELKTMKTPAMTSRQMSTGFIVNKEGIERSPSVEKTLDIQKSVFTDCDKVRNINKIVGTPPIRRQTKIHSCETIYEESESLNDCSQQGSTSGDKSNVILGIDDLFNDVKESDIKERDEKISLSSKPEEDEQMGSSKTSTESDSFDSENMDVLPDKELHSFSSNRKERRLNKEAETIKLDTSVMDKSLDKSSNRNVNEPGCSHHYNDSHSLLAPSLDCELVTVTSTTALTTSSRLLTCTPDNLDSDSFAVCQSLSRSTTPSICSMEMSTPPLSPLSISPFDFIIPVSPLPPSPIKEVEDRVSPLSPEHLSEHLAEQFDGTNEESASNENEKNVGNIPVVRTPEKPIAQKFLEYSPVPDLISPIKTPKQSSTHQKKKRKGKGKRLASDEMDANSPIKFGSNVPSGVLTVKPKTTNNSLNNDKNAVDSFKVGRMSSKSLDLRKHVTLKESADIWSNRNSVFKRKVEKKADTNDTKMEHSADHDEKSVIVRELKPSLPTVSSLTDKTNDQIISKPKYTDIQEGKEINDRNENMPTETKETCILTDGQADAKGDSKDEKLIESFDNDKSITINASGDNVNGNSETNATSSSKDSDSTLKDKVTDLVGVKDVEIEMDCEETKRVADVVPIGYSDPLMASKRKTRMAHQPRSQPLIVKKPPVIIEPIFLTPGNRRKRKSQDSNDKEVVPKKQAKAVVFQKQNVALDNSSQENSRKMEGFLKSAEKTEHFINSFKDIPANKSIGLFITDLCLECIGRLKADMLDTIHQSCVSGTYLTMTEDDPFLNNVEKKAVELLITLSGNKDMGIDTEGVCKLLWTCIFTKELTVTMVGKMSLVKIFTAICLKEGDAEQVRVLLYGISTCGYLNHWLFVVPVVSVWPEVLRKDLSMDTSRTQSVLSIFEYVITKALLGQGTASSTKVLAIMEKLCNWSGVLENPETLLKALTTNLFDICNEQPADTNCTFAIVKACKLLLMTENWAWFKEYFINRQGLQSAVNRYLCKKGTVASNYMCAVLEITGSMITYWSESAKPRDLQQICRLWLMAILSKQQGDPLVQHCCLDTILEISAHYPSVISTLHTWLKKNPNNSVEGYTERLEAVRQAFSIDCEPFVKR